MALALENLPTTEALVLGALLFALLLGLVSFVSASEMALVSLSRVRRRQLLEDGDPRIRPVEKALADTPRFMSTTLFATIVASLAAAVLVTGAAQPVAGALGVVVALVVVAIVILTFGYLMPRAYASRHPERLALATAPILLLIQRVLTPFVFVFERMTRHLLPPREAPREDELRGEEDLKTFITLGTEEGLLEEEEQHMLHSVIEFGETTAKEIMVPRIDMVAIAGDAQLEHVKAFILDSGFSRIPIYQGTVDNVVGVLHVKDLLLHLLDKKANAQVKDLMREAFFIPETKKLDELLNEMREKRVHMAIVIDEFGGTAGLLTLEDVLEEIVGEIFDESDLRVDPIRKLDDLTAIVDAKTHVADVNDALDLEIPEDEGYDTVAGYVFHRLGRLGKEGELVHGPGFDLVVEKVTNRRIVRAKIVKHRAPDTPPHDETGPLGAT